MRKWYQGVTHFGGFNLDQILSGIKYVLVCICNCFVFNLLTFSTFIYEVIRFKLVLRHLCRKIEELYMSGKEC